MFSIFIINKAQSLITPIDMEIYRNVSLIAYIEYELELYTNLRQNKKSQAISKLLAQLELPNIQKCCLYSNFLQQTFNVNYAETLQHVNLVFFLESVESFCLQKPLYGTSDQFNCFRSFLQLRFICFCWIQKIL